MTLRARCVTVALIAAAASPYASAAQQGCDISTAMEQKRQEERDRRMNDIDTRFDVLQKANDLMKMCLDNFPSYPTQLPSTTILQEAFRRVKQQACEGLTKKAQQNYDAAVQAARNTANDAIKGATNSLPGGIGNNLPGVINGGGIAGQSSPSSPGSSTGGIVDSLRRFFQ
ncbi:hypothetical protein [Cupriavidus sp. L7L]|uniref:hypothetical protein n=1 Tax=Cupriavidus sp. L7L TaxID=2546443 RepID=UPI00105478D1|nr:hypothetical protein [Cupriavidus sp. L7L]TDF52144.1 hypothetical protein E1J61_37210 [Cupriavidus sp. L7L]